MRSTAVLSFAAAAVAASSAIPDLNIVQRLQLIPDASTLVTAVVAGGLAATLSGTGPFTVFAPSNDAFMRLPPGVLDALLKNVTALDEVLTYHVVAGNVSSSQLKDGPVATLDKPEQIYVDIHPAGPQGVIITLDRDSQVTYANNYATNGVFHFIDRVLIPRHLEAQLSAAAAPVADIPPYNLVERLQLIPQFSTLVTAVVVGKLAGALSAKGPFTLFAPNDMAFQRLPPGVLDRLLHNVTELDEILTYHVASGNVSSSDLKDGEQVPTLNGKSILVNIMERFNHTEVILNDHVRVVNANTYVTNGVFHEIDDILLPPRFL